MKKLIVSVLILSLILFLPALSACGKAPAVAATQNGQVASVASGPLGENPENPISFNQFVQSIEDGKYEGEDRVVYVQGEILEVLPPNFGATGWNRGLIMGDGRLVFLSTTVPFDIDDGEGEKYVSYGSFAGLQAGQVVVVKTSIGGQPKWGLKLNNRIIFDPTTIIR